jgi:SPX domain protein involved in polyphosphate accumulation
MDSGFDIDRLARLFQDSKLPDAIRALVGTLQPALLNRYHRKYYQSADGHYRVTLDSNLEFYRLRPRQNFFLHHTTEREHQVLELKYGSRHAAGAELAANAFPFRVGKISKYVLGLDFLDAC